MSLITPVPKHPHQRRTRDPEPLSSSQLLVTINDLLAEFDLRHEFRNDGTAVIEVVYTFPIPLDAAFLGMTAMLAGETRTAIIQSKTKALDTYDTAVAEGDAAVLLESPEPGLLTVSLGNLKPGEAGNISLRFATALACGDGQARFSLPLVHRPRFGDYRMDPWAVPSADFATQHPLEAEIRIRGLLANVPVRCALHGAKFQSSHGETFLKLSQAMLDRDLVLLFDIDGSVPASGTWITDGDDSIALIPIVAPTLPTDTPAMGLNLCLVLDCSGSMQGGAIEQSRSAVRAVADALTEHDRIQLIRFGTEVTPMFRRALRTSKNVRQAIQELAPTIDANLGGTNMDGALDEALSALEPLDGPAIDKVIVLVTDGAVQPMDVAIVQERARQSGIRIFVVAVGSSAGVDVLQPMSDETGAVLERAVPSEPIDAAVMRHFRRARNGKPNRPAIHCDLPGSRVLPIAPMYAGDASNAVVFLKGTARPNLNLKWNDAEAVPVTFPEQCSPAPAWRAWAGQYDYRSQDDATCRESIAMRYGLITAETSAVLVKVRAESDKAETLPVTVTVRQMIPDGMLGLAFSRMSASFAGSALPPGIVACYSPPSASAFADRPSIVHESDSSPYDEPTLTEEQQSHLDAVLLAALIDVLLVRDLKDGIEPAIRALLSNDDLSLLDRFLAGSDCSLDDANEAASLLDDLLESPTAPELSDDQEAALAILLAGERD